MNDPEELQSIINDLEENNVLTNTYIAEKGKEIERLNAGWHEANVTNLKQAEQLATLQTKLEQVDEDRAELVSLITQIRDANTEMQSRELWKRMYGLLVKYEVKKS